MSAPAHFTTPFPNALIECSTMTVPEEWIDYNGHMNIGFYLLAFDRSQDVLFDEWLDVGKHYVARTGMGPFALQAQIHFLKELRLGERFRVEAQLLDHDHKRLHYASRMVNLETGAVAAISEGLSINVNLTERRSAPYPEAQVRRLGELLEAQRDVPVPPQVGATIGIRRASS
ncbi:MAG: thioesterase family protein [Pseudomonadota bacterium]